jgi:hypothetical protein
MPARRAAGGARIRAPQKQVQQGNVVYHGFAGWFFLQGVPDVFKVLYQNRLNPQCKENAKGNVK